MRMCREQAEADLYQKGPLSVLTSSVKTNSMVLSIVGPLLCSAQRVSPTPNPPLNTWRFRATAVRHVLGRFHRPAATFVPGLLPTPAFLRPVKCKPRRNTLGAHAGADQLQEQPQALGAREGV